MTAPNIPLWLTPQVPGMLSNTRGANTGADARPLQVKYSSQRATDKAGTMRVLAVRSVFAGATQGPETVWDSDYIGSPPTTPVPTAVTAGTGIASYIYNGRVYVAPILATQSTPPAPTVIYSSPITGRSTGQWRRENSIVWNVASGGGLSSFTMSNGFFYACDAASNIAYAPIGGDGQIGTWITSSAKPAQPGQLVGGTADPTAPVPNQGFLMIFGGGGFFGAGAASTSVQNVGLNVDGSLQAWVNGTVLPAARQAMGIFYNPLSKYIVVAGGENAGAQATVWHAPVTNLGAVGTWVTTDQVLPAVRRQPAITFNYTNNTLYVLGGDAAGVAQTTNYQHSVTGAGAITGAWTTGTALGTATTGAGAFVGGTSAPQPVVVAGTITAVQAYTGAAWVNGPQTLAGGSLGTGGTIVNNLDGTQTITFNYGAFGPAQLSNLGDGDQVTLFVTFTDSQNGDPSPSKETIVKIGQPPTLSSLSPSGAIATGQPVLSFGYNIGAGGGPQASWRAKILGATTGVVYADSLIRVDLINTWTPLIAPMLDNTEGYTLSVTITSTDVPIDVNSSDSATSTSSFTITGIPPATPTPVSLVTSAILCGPILTWTNPTGGTAPGFNRIYYRRSGTLQWFLLIDSLIALVNVAQSTTLIDQMVMTGTFDFSVSAVDTTGGLESIACCPRLDGDLEYSAGTAVLWRSIGTEAGTDNSIAYWPVNIGPVTYAAHVLTLPTGGFIVGGHLDWWDIGPVNAQFTMAASYRPGLTLRTTGTTLANANWVQAWVDGVNVHLTKKVGGVVTLNVVAAVACALVNATVYWIQGQVVGNVYTFKILNDNANTPGTTIATITGTITDPILATGRVGLKNGGDGEGSAASGTFGTANPNVFTATGPVPANGVTIWSPIITAGEPAFCWSKNSPYSGVYSLSIYNAIAAGQGLWRLTITYPSLLYTLAGQLRGTGVPTAFRLDTADSTIVTSAPTADSAWHAVSATGTPAANSTPRFVAQGQGTYYVDAITFTMTGVAAVTIPTPTGGYTGMLHVPGSLTLYAPIFIKGGPGTAEHLETSSGETFGMRAPLVRVGEEDFRDMDVTLQVFTSADFTALQNVLVVMRNGGSVYYRTAAGHLLTVALKPDQSVAFAPEDYGIRTVTLGLTEVANTYAPILTQGVSRGLLTQVGGSAPQLSPVELGI